MNMSIIEKALQKAAILNDGPEKDMELLKHKVAEIVEPERIINNQHVVVDLAAQKLNKSAGRKINTIQIEWQRLGGAGFISPEQTNSQLSEEYRVIKRPLVANAMNGKSRGIVHSNLILVTSSLPGEGKTFSAINLAISIANERDKQVLLIDADVAKPSVSKVLGIKDSPGLIEYLDGSVNDFSEIILQTDIEGLRLIPAGKRHGYSTELLASNKMKQFSMELSERYADRIVIFDSPPLLAATQGEVLSTMVGQVVLVIEADQTQQNDVMESVRKLKDCDVVLALLNKTRHNFNLNYYGYGNYGS
jgi:protein-tyrosine kinase